MCTERGGEVLYQRGEKSLAGFRGGTLENRAQSRIGFQAVEREDALVVRGGHD
jgi:hypothetical protein